MYSVPSANYSFYLRDAQMIVKAAEKQKDASDESILNTIRQIWESAEGRPSDEYLCIVDISGTRIHGAIDRGAGFSCPGPTPVGGFSLPA